MLASSPSHGGINITVEEATATGSLYNTTTTFTATPVIESFSSYTPGINYLNTSFGPLGTIDGFRVGTSTVQGVLQQWAQNYGGAPYGEITINFGQKTNYFGINLIWVNGGNTVTFYNGTNKALVFNDVTLDNFISSRPLYFKNGSGTDPDPSAFINFYDDSSDGGFTKVVLSGNWFESTNYTLGNYLTQSGTSILNTLTVNSPLSGSVPVNIQNGAYTGLSNNSSITAPDVAVYNLNNNLYSLDNNSGGIISSGIFGIQNSSAIGTLTNQAGAFINGSNSAILNDVGNSITKIVNAGVIGKYASNTSNYGIYNYASTSTIDQINNTGTIYGNLKGIYNVGSITTITNTGEITNGAGGVGITNTGSISTLNNLQGKSSTPLAYTNELPTNYNIIINSLSDYGQLSGSSLSGSTIFNIYSGSTITSKLYSAVLSGLVGSNISGAKNGTYNGINWTLALQSGSLDTWDLIFSGGLTADTQSSIEYQASQLRSTFNTQYIAANFGLNHDCNLFDENNMCISAGGRYTSIDNTNTNNSAASVALGYKVNSNLRFGAYLDQNVNNNNPTGIYINNKMPLLGVSLVWNDQEDGLGYQLKIANSYQEQDITSTRKIFNTSEPGSGKSTLTSQSYLAELSYAFKYDDDNLIRQYASLRYSDLKQDRYTEVTSDSVTDPLSIATLKDKAATAIIGMRFNHLLTSKTTLTAQVGLEQDLYHKVNNYSATDLNLNNLTPVAFDSNIKRMRPLASAGAYYALAKNQRVSGEIFYQQLPFQSSGSATAYFKYLIGF